MSAKCQEEYLANIESLHTFATKKASMRRFLLSYAKVSLVLNHSCVY